MNRDEITEDMLKEMQREYDDNKLSATKVQKIFGVKNHVMWDLIKENKFFIRSKSEQQRISSIGRVHSEDTKKKISEKRKQYLKQNPDKVPYKLNHHSLRQSYPEKYFEDWLIKEKIPFIKEYQVELYSLDFLIGNVDFEIDGSQHYCDKRIQASDERRSEFLVNLGYKIHRVKWSDFQKMNTSEKEVFLQELKKFFMGNNVYAPLVICKDKFCVDCGQKILSTSERCRCCQQKKRECSKYSNLLEERNHFSNVELGKKYGVSETQIRKQLKKKIKQIKQQFLGASSNGQDS